MVFWEYLREFNFVSILTRVVLAMILGGITGLERGKQGRAAGMRTHILVCLGATLTAMLGYYSATVLAPKFGFTSDPLRVGAQVISGIGFLGVGTILIKGRFQITGLTTAAGLWCAAAVGLALGAGFFEGAFLTFIAALITITVVHKLEYTINKKYRRFGIYMEINSCKSVRCAVEALEGLYKISDVQVTAPRSGIKDNVGIEAVVHNSSQELTPKVVSLELEKLEFVVFALESI